MRKVMSMIAVLALLVGLSVTIADAQKGRTHKEARQGRGGSNATNSVVTINMWPKLVVETDCGDVRKGDLVFVNVVMGVINGAVAGRLVFAIQEHEYPMSCPGCPDKTATIVMGHDARWVAQSTESDADETHYFTLSVIARVISPGTLHMGAYGWNDGAVATIPRGAGQIYCLVRSLR